MIASGPKALVVILGGGRGTRLAPLTRYRSKPAVPLGGKYRLIDITVSNAINSGLRQIFVLTQFQSASLNRHVSNTFRFDPFSRGFVEVLAPSRPRRARTGTRARPTPCASRCPASCRATGTT